MRVARGGGQKHNLRGLHGVIRGEDKAQGVALILVYRARGAGDGDQPLVNAIRLLD